MTFQNTTITSSMLDKSDYKEFVDTDSGIKLTVVHQRGTSNYSGVTSYLPDGSNVIWPGGTITFPRTFFHISVPNDLLEKLSGSELKSFININNSSDVGVRRERLSKIFTDLESAGIKLSDSTTKSAAEFTEKALEPASRVTHGSIRLVLGNRYKALSAEEKKTKFLEELNAWGGKPSGTDREELIRQATEPTKQTGAGTADPAVELEKKRG